MEYSGPVFLDTGYILPYKGNVIILRPLRRDVIYAIVQQVPQVHLPLYIAH